MLILHLYLIIFRRSNFRSYHILNMHISFLATLLLLSPLVLAAPTTTSSAIGAPTPDSKSNGDVHRADTVAKGVQRPSEKDKMAEPVKPASVDEKACAACKTYCEGWKKSSKMTGAEYAMWEESVCFGKNKPCGEKGPATAHEKAD